MDANLTRTGVFVYRDANGKEVREYRSPDEVFKADSLETLKLAPVVVGHPAMVGPENFKQHVVGTAAEDVRRDGIFVRSSLVIQDANTIGKIDHDELVEVSLGYETDLLHEPGTTPEGERFDAKQTNIRYNHVGLGPKGWGRAGGEVRLRLDGNGDVVMPTAEVPTGSGMLTAEQEKARADKAEADLKTATARADKAEGERDAEKTRADKSEAELAKLRTDSKVDVPALVAARTALEMSARSVLGADAKLTIKEDGKDERPMTDAEVIVAVIAKDDDKFKADGKEPGYLRARFDMIVERTVKTDAAHQQLGGAINEATKTGGATEKSPIDLALEKRDAENAKLAQGGPPPGATVRKD